MEAAFEKALDEAIAKRARVQRDGLRGRFLETAHDVLTDALLRLATVDYDALTVTVGGVKLLYPDWPANFLFLAKEDGQPSSSISNVEELKAAIDARRASNAAFPLPNSPTPSVESNDDVAKRLVELLRNWIKLQVRDPAAADAAEGILCSLIGVLGRDAESLWPRATEGDPAKPPRSQAEILAALEQKIIECRARIAEIDALLRGDTA